MAFEGMSFNLFSDTTLLVGFGGFEDLLHYTDQSDNPQDKTLYLGSLNTTRKLQVTTDPGIDNIIITPTYILPSWAASTAYILGKRVKPTVSDGFVYVVTTAGTSGATEPVWPVGGLGSTVVDGTIVWSKLSMQHLVTEVKLAITQGGLAAATAGASLSLGPTILGGVPGAIPIWMRYTNSVTNVADNTGYEEVALYINEIIEAAIL